MKKHLLRMWLASILMVFGAVGAWADTETVTVLSEDYESYDVGDITATMTGKGWKFQSRNGKNQITIVQGANDVNTTKYFDFYYPDGGASRNQSWDFGTSSSLNADNWKLTFSAALNPGTNNSANKFWITGTNTGKITDANSDVTNPIFGLIGTAQAAVTYKPSIGATAYNEEITLNSGTWYKFTIEATNIDASNIKANLTVKITSYDGTTTIWEKTVNDYDLSTSGTLKGLCWNSPRGYSRLSLDDVLVTKEVSADICAEPTFNVTGTDGSSRKIELTCETAGATIYYASSELEKGAAGWTLYEGEFSTGEATIYAYAARGAITSEIVSFATGAGEAISLNAPVIVSSGLVANGDIYNPILTATNDQTSVQFTPTATMTATFNGAPVELPYTVTEDGTLVVTVAAEGYTSASTEMSLKAKYTKNWSSSNFSALTEEDVPTVMGENWQKQDATGRWASWTSEKEPYTYFAAVGEESVFNVTVEDNLRMRNVVLLNLGYGLARNVTGGEAINFLNSKAGTIAEVTYYNGYGADVSEANTHTTYLFNAGEGIPSFSTTNGNVFVQATYYTPVVENKAIFLKPGVWNVDGARYAAYTFGDGEAWIDFAAAEEAGVFTANVPDNYTGLILVRLNGETTENNWGNKWNQTDDIDFTAVANNTLFTITGWGEGNSTYETSEYTTTEPVLNDYTSYIVNADLTGEGGWDATGTKGIDKSGIVKVGNAAAFDFKQTIANLPAGKYKLTAQAAYRYGDSEESEYEAIQSSTETKLVQLYATAGAKTVSTKVMNRWDGASDTDYANGDGSKTINEKFVPNSSNAVKAWFNAGQYVNEVEFNNVADGDVTIGINRTGTPASDYTVIGPWTLTRLGDADPVVLQDFSVSFTTNAVWDKVYAYVWSGEGQDKVLGEWPGTEMTEKDGTYSITFQAEEAPEKIIFNNGNGGTGNQTADLAFENGKAYEFTVSGQVLDVTELFIVNPSFETGDLTGWANSGNSSDTGVKENGGNYATSNCDGKYVYNTWWQGTALTQTVANLPEGSYTLSAILASSDGNLDGKVFMQVNETRKLFTFPVNTGGVGVRCELPFTMTAASDATITIIGANDAGEWVDAGHWWYKADDFHLILNIDDVIPAAIVEKLLADAPTDPMEASVKSALEDAIATLQANATIKNYNAAIKAIAAAKESIEHYKALKEAIDLVKSYDATLDFSDINNKFDKGLYTAESTQKDVFSAYQALEVVKLGTADNTDYTKMVINPSFETGNTIGWNYDISNDHGAKRNDNATYTMTNCDGDYLFNIWSSGNSVWQIVENLPNGSYKLQAVVASDAEKQIQLFGNQDLAQINTDASGKGVGVEGELEFKVLNNQASIGAEGINKQWYKVDNFRLTLLKAFNLEELVAAYNDALADAQAVEGIMNRDVEEALQNAINATVDKNDADAVTAATAALTEATANAKASIAAYAQAKAALDAMKNILDGTNVYTTEAFETYNGIYTANNDKYQTRTMTDDEAKALVNPDKAINWGDRGKEQYSDAAKFLLSAWEPSFGDFSNYYINTWSTEGENDGTNFLVPFFEYWTSDGNSLGAKTLTATMENMPAGEYTVSAWVRVRMKNNATAPATGVTFQVNDGETVNVANGDQVGESQFYLKNFTATGTVGADGKLLIKFIVDADNNISWLSFKNVKFEAPVTHTYNVAGTANLCGAEWDATQNPMTLNTETNLYEWTKEGVEVTTTSVPEFKVVEDGTNWYPDGDGSTNWKITPDYLGGEGVYTITITFNAETKEIGVSGVKAITDGIDALKAEALKGNVYNLNGQKVNKIQKGLYIVNGKKVVKK